MKTTVEIGYGYALRSEMGGEVANAETGKTLETLEPNKQVHMTAQEPEWVVPDDCQVTKMRNFNHALAVAGLLGGGADKLPAGYRRVEYLESSGTQWINTGVMPTGDTKVSVDVEATAFSYTNYVFGSEHVDGPNILFSLSIAGANANAGLYRYSSQLVTFAYGAHNVNVRYFYEFDRNVAYRNGVFTPFRYNNTIELEDFVGKKSLLLFASRHESNNVTPSGSKRIWSFKIEQSGKRVLEFIPALTPAGEPCMFDLVTRKPLKNAGTGQFVVGMTLSQVRGLRLPAGGGKLTLALPHEASIDRLAQAALERARANGWELTLQYAEAEVPAGYRRLDFLESTCTQYIDTGVKLSNESEVKCEYMLTEDNGFIEKILFGGPRSGVSGYVYFAMSKVSWYFYCGDKRQIANLCADYGTKVHVITNSDGVTYNGEINLFPSEVSSFETDEACIFKNTGASLSVPSRIYALSISRAGEMQVDYIPCISPDGKLGMYNKVDGIMKENAGRGAFIAGLATVDDVRNLWLPETSGELTVSVPADTPDSAVEQLRANNPTWQIAIQYRTENHEN